MSETKKDNNLICTRLPQFEEYLRGITSVIYEQINYLNVKRILAISNIKEVPKTHNPYGPNHEPHYKFYVQIYTSSHTFVLLGNCSIEEFKEKINELIIGSSIKDDLYKF